jgi:hypothetical protein
MRPLDPSYVPLLTFLGTLLIVAVGILVNNSRITDMKDSFTDLRDLIKAESRVTEVNAAGLMRRSTKSKTSS